MVSKMCSVPILGVDKLLTPPQSLIVPVEVNGKMVAALINTGSMQTLVEKMVDA